MENEKPEEKAEEDKPKTPIENPSDGIPALEENPIKQAQDLLKSIHAENLLMIEERKRIEKATAEMLVNGRSYAGQAPKIETADEKWKREAKERYAGTGMDPTE